MNEEERERKKEKMEKLRKEMIPTVKSKEITKKNEEKSTIKK